MVTYSVECTFCDEELEIYIEEELEINFCPHCGEPANAIELDSDGY